MSENDKIVEFVSFIENLRNYYNSEKPDEVNSTYMKYHYKIETLDEIFKQFVKIYCENKKVIL